MYSGTSNNGHCRGISVLSVIGGTDNFHNAHVFSYKILVQTYRNKSAYFSDNCRSDALVFFCSSSICTLSSVVNHFIFTDISSVNKSLHTLRVHKGEWLKGAGTQVRHYTNVLQLEEDYLYSETKHRLRIFPPQRWGRNFAHARCLPSFTGKPVTVQDDQAPRRLWNTVCYPLSAFIHGDFRK